MNSKQQQNVLHHIALETNISGWSIDEHVIDSRECLIYKATNTQFDHNIAIKIYRQNLTAPKGQNPLSQYDALLNCATLFNQAGSKYRAPQGYGRLPQQDAFFMEWIEAPTLQYRLLRYCYHKNKQQDDITRTFEWLKKYHLLVGDMEIKPVNIDWYAKQIQESIDNFDSDQRLKKDPIFRFGLETLLKKSKSFDKLKVQHAKAHGDFTPANILIDDETVTGIDIHASSQPTPVCNEIALQLSYIFTGYINMLPKSEMKNHPDCWEILQVSLKGYNYPKDTKQKEFLLYILLFQLLRRWLVIADRNKNRKTPLLDLWSLRNSKSVVEGVSHALTNISKNN